MTTGTAAGPHTRWAIQATLARLDASHAKAQSAIGALRAAEARRDRRRARARARGPLGDRIAGGRGWFRTIRLGVALAARATFLAWISARLVMHLATVPVWVAVIPGLLLTTAFAGTASYAARSLQRPAVPGIVGLLRPSVPLAIASASLIA